MKFDATKLYDFFNVKLYRASDAEGGGWNGYGQGHLCVNFINKYDGCAFDCRGMGQLTYHNELTKAGGLNLCIVKNFVIELSEKEPRLTFKGASDVFGSNGLKNMYTMKMGSFEDAKRLVSIVHLLERAANQAAEGNRILLPGPQSVEAITARTLIGADETQVERQLIVSKLIQLAIEKDRDFPSVSHAGHYAADHTFNLGDDTVDNTNGAETDNTDAAASFHHLDTADEVNYEDESNEEAEFEPLTPDSAKWQESQQWQFAF
ncbi:unnamed protein product [Cylindrotheca closterium]|uniref:Uncharacterized protein n=1 Tax=Cylindrotheca closterium TaxID=2856 RepID=A0AAD2GBM3_9STRA|nr:unnamed protein product [Cylindrotheca closterium]